MSCSPKAFSLYTDDKHMGIQLIETKFQKIDTLVGRFLASLFLFYLMIMTTHQAIELEEEGSEDGSEEEEEPPIYKPTAQRKDI